MFVYCLLRLWKAGVSVLWAAPPPVSASGSDSSRQGVPFEGVMGDGDVFGGEGVGEDPATRLVRFALSRHLLGDVDAEGWSEVCTSRVYCCYWCAVLVLSSAPLPAAFLLFCCFLLPNFAGKNVTVC